MRQVAALAISLCITVSATADLAGLSDQLHSLVFDRRNPNGQPLLILIDAPLWPQTHYLLEGISHAKVVPLLDQLAVVPLGDSTRDLRYRALLQHELWQIFDWTTESTLNEPVRVEIRKKLAVAILRLALTKEQIDALPSGLAADNADTNAPPNVIDEHSGWTGIGLYGFASIAQAHMTNFGGRSAFGVFMHHPQGKDAAADFLKKLAAASFWPLSDVTMIPQFPAGTRLALLRRMMLIDRSQQLICSPIIQSLQMRTFLNLDAPHHDPKNVRLQEFELDRAAYLAGHGSALPDVSEKSVIQTFRDKGIDPFEMALGSPRPVVETCFACHSQPNVLSMNSYTRFFSFDQGSDTRLQIDDFDHQSQFTVQYKEQQFSWGLLRGIWESTTSTIP